MRNKFVRICLEVTTQSYSGNPEVKHSILKITLIDNAASLLIVQTIYSIDTKDFRVKRPHAKLNVFGICIIVDTLLHLF